MNKKKIVLSITLCIMSLLFLKTDTFANINQSTMGQIEKNVSEEISKAKIPDTAIAIIQSSNVEYLYCSDNNKNSNINGDTLFQIGSLSKAYTGLGILLLEDEGLLSLDDPVSKYLPWFSVMFEGKTVPSEELTIANLLYQTSGFTNAESKYPSARQGMSLNESIQQISGSTLMHYPSKQYDYANTNYRILGLIIEKVIKQSYEVFMTEKILSPLGLKNTYADLSIIPDTAAIATGSRLSFYKAWSYDVPVVQANVPAGYIYSNVVDMSRWLQIQMGEIEVTKQFERIIKKSHQPNQSSIVDSNTHYAAGWFINDVTAEIYHSGGTPNYSTNVTLRPENNTAVCVLTNMNASANTNHIASTVLNVMENKPTTAYPTDVWMIFDLIFSLITIIGIISTIILIVTVIRQVLHVFKGQRKRVKLKGKSILLFIPSVFLTAITAMVVILIPIIFSSSWGDLCLWAPYSLLLGTISFFVMSVFALILTYVSCRYKKVRI